MLGFGLQLLGAVCRLNQTNKDTLCIRQSPVPEPCMNISQTTNPRLCVRHQSNPKSYALHEASAKSQALSPASAKPQSFQPCMGHQPGVCAHMACALVLQSPAGIRLQEECEGG